MRSPGPPPGLWCVRACTYPQTGPFDAPKHKKTIYYRAFLARIRIRFYSEKDPDPVYIGRVSTGTVANYEKSASFQSLIVIKKINMVGRYLYVSTVP